MGEKKKRNTEISLLLHLHAFSLLSKGKEEQNENKVLGNIFKRLALPGKYQMVKKNMLTG